jgi:outer membrane protein assembly factor BamD (BamD/ComL family)
LNLGTLVASSKFTPDPAKVTPWGTVFRGRRWRCVLIFMMAALGGGCQTDSPLLAKLNPADNIEKIKLAMFRMPELPPLPAESFVMRGGGLEAERTLDPESPQGKLERTKILFAQGDYKQPEKVFHYLVHATKNDRAVVEEALFYEAECQYMRNDFSKAEATYRKLLDEFQLMSRFQRQATRRMYDIALYWLQDTHAVMKAYAEIQEGKRWFYNPYPYIHFEKKKPFLDEEGRAMRALETVYMNDFKGPLGEKALMQLATIHFYRGNYRDADLWYGKICEDYPESKIAPEAMKRLIICKQMMTGGSAYDAKPLQQARDLIQKASRYPELRKDEEFLKRQLLSISHQQADKDYNIAEFYRRTGHPGAAYFYYELVRRRYPGSTYAEKATKRMEDLHRRLQKDEPRVAPLGPESNPSMPPGNGGQKPALLPPTLLSGGQP